MVWNGADTMLTCNITEDEQRYGRYERLSYSCKRNQRIISKNDALEGLVSRIRGVDNLT